MKKIAAVFLVGVFFWVGATLLLQKQHHMHSSTSPCVISALQGNCPEEHSLASLGSHFQAFKSVLPGTGWRFILLLAFAFPLFFVFQNDVLLNAGDLFQKRQRRFLEIPPSVPRRRFFSWLALHEKSPCSVI